MHCCIVFCVQMQTELMGTDHIYNVDTFNEMVPASSDPEYLANTSAAVYQGMKAADPQAVWLMQGWLFRNKFWTEKTVKPYLDAVPNTGMIILDLYTEANPVWSKYDSYYGKPFIWCMLHNFGGRRSLCGNLTRIATGPTADRLVSTMNGIGLTPEAIEQNPVVYEMMLETGWTTEAINVPSWIADYVYGRYGPAGGNPSLQEAWVMLTESVYQYNFPQTFLGILHKSPVIPRAHSRAPRYTEPLDPSIPGYDGMHSPQSKKVSLSYGFAGVTAAWRAMVKGVSTVSEEQSMNTINGPLSYDLVDVGRQVLVDTHNDLVTLVSAAFLRWREGGHNTSTELDVMGKTLLGIVKDLDSLLLTDPNYLLGNWLETAKSWGTNDVERRRMEANARYQITLWGPSGQINDYAEKHWAGLVGTYYYGRWSLWLSTLQNAVKTGKPVDTEKYGADLLSWEQNWCQSNESHTTVPAPGVVAVSQSLVESWAMPSSGSQYKAYPNTVVNKFDIHPGTPLVSKDIDQMKVLCDVEPSCVGFISTGYLKTAVDVRKTLEGCDLYVKIPSNET